MSENKKKVETKKETKVANETKKATKPVEVKEAKKTTAKKATTKKVETKKVEVKKEEPKKVETKKVKKEKSPEFAVVTLCVVVMVALIGLLSWYFSREAYQPIATFEGGSINKTEFLPYYKMFNMQYGAYYGEDKTEELKTQAAEQAAVSKKLVLLAKENNLELTTENKAEIEAQLVSDNIKNLTESTDLTETDVRKIFTDGEYANLYMEFLATKLPKEEVDKYVAEKYKDADLTSYVSRHILFTTKDEEGNDLDASAKAQVKIKATAVLKRALAGEDFAKLAEEFSADTSSATNGGLIEFVDNKELVEEYVAAAKTLSKGKVYETLVETAYGYHIIKLDDKVENGRLEKIKLEMLDDEYQKIVEDTKVEINDTVLTSIVL